MGGGGWREGGGVSSQRHGGSSGWVSKGPKGFGTVWWAPGPSSLWLDYSPYASCDAAWYALLEGLRPTRPVPSCRTYGTHRTEAVAATGYMRMVSSITALRYGSWGRSSCCSSRARGPPGPPVGGRIGTSNSRRPNAAVDYNAETHAVAHAVAPFQNCPRTSRLCL